MKTKVILAISLIGSMATAQVDIDYKVDLLQKNVENAQSNFDRFKENLTTSVKNFNEATRTVNELRNLKKQAIKDKKRSDSNALTYASVLEKYNEFVAQEQANILKESDAVQKLEALILKVKENTAKRQNLIVSYNAEVEKMRSEIENWRQKEREVSSVIEDIESREVGALEERLLWEEKKETYRGEAKKWASELKTAEKTYSIFKNLRD